MQQSIESFVRTLQEDGVKAGKAAADSLRQAAEVAAGEIIAKANAEAARLLEDAKHERDMLADRQEQELRLGARDAVLTLQYRLCKAVEAMLDEQAATVLGDDTHLVQFIESVATVFATKQANHPDDAIVFTVASEDAKTVVDRALSAIVRRDVSSEQAVFCAETGLLDLGFEYRQGGSVVEVTPGTVVSLLSPLVSEEVGRRIQSALDNPDNRTVEENRD